MSASKFYDGYEKLKTVGQGAFGTATLYKRLKDGENVVMKEIYTMNMDQIEKKAALNEVEILATLNHTNIIQYIGNFQKDESLIIIMEYANGGNLAQLINSKRDKNEVFLEKSVLNILEQIVSALAYMHGRRILHRDLKTANIFLSLNGVVKIGDFGISKMLNTKSQAQTVVGTPYYLSPEMCEGYDYNEKSDIWAVGCILYELLTLRKPFEAPTLPVLVQKITQCIYEDIPSTYCSEFNQIVRAILQKNPELRPPAQYISDVFIPRIHKKMEASNSNNPLSKRATPQTGFKGRSILYTLTDCGPMQKIAPIELPHRTALDFSVSPTHEIVITSDNCVYYCEEPKTTYQKKLPVKINHLNEHKITKCGNGCDFTILLNDRGFLLSFGDGKNGCLGHGDYNNSNEPTLINSLVNTKITEIRCGDEHVAALSFDGRVFTWGSSKNGELGQGHNQRRCKPLALYLPEFPKIREVFCGRDATALLTPNGQVLVAGNNSHGKLGVPAEKQINLFTPLRNLKERIKSVSIGVHHTAMLTDSGSVLAMGRNFEGQLGKGTTVAYNQPQKINFNFKITMLKCGLNFTVAADNSNVVWFWGAHYLPRKELANFSESHDSLKSSNLGVPLIKSNPKEVELKSYTPDHQDYELFEIVKSPHSILAFYSSEKNRKTGNVIYLDRMEATSNKLFLLAHTTSPPPVKQFSGNNDKSNSFVASNDLSTGTPGIVTSLPNTPRLDA